MEVFGGDGDFRLVWGKAAKMDGRKGGGGFRGFLFCKGLWGRGWMGEGSDGSGLGGGWWMGAGDGQLPWLLRQWGFGGGDG
ncbi:hypothetical protein Ancab_010611 [Ancistrocladus abbreviatus]